MNVEYIECDFCKQKEQLRPARCGSYHNWIEIKKCVGQSGEKLETGVSHFCDEKCLINKLLEGKKKK